MAFMPDDPGPALDRMAEDTRILRDGLEADIKKDAAKAKGEGEPSKRPWWKFWARS
jgi:hypothetical protein